MSAAQDNEPFLGQDRFADGQRIAVGFCMHLDAVPGIDGFLREVGKKCAVHVFLHGSFRTAKTGDDGYLAFLRQQVADLLIDSLHDLFPSFGMHGLQCMGCIFQAALFS